MTDRPLSARVAANVRVLRRLRRWSAQDLADRLAATNAPISRSVIANRELGRHGASAVTVDELVALAAAFDREPMDLLAERIVLCEQCGDQPPAGFACLACGAGKTLTSKGDQRDDRPAPSLG